MSKTIATFFALILIASIGFAQEIIVDPYGVTPANVKRDTTDGDQYMGGFFAEYGEYTGLIVVGVESNVYVRATFVDSFFTSPVWNITDMPEGSAASIITGPTPPPEKYEDWNGADIVVFNADLEGTYTIVASEGTFADTIVFEADTYEGVEHCAGCHDGSMTTDMVTPWEGTGHSDMLDRMLDGANDHYSSDCISCHTVGYDENADNDGFGEFGFVFPDTLYVGMADSMYAEYPEDMALANIQCENCHGPGGHNKGTEKDVFKLAVDQCAKCHDDDNHHLRPSELMTSAHMSGSHLYNSSYAGGSCVPCHNGRGFINAMDDVSETLTEKVPITCSVCHDPHDATNVYQLRTLEATLGNDFEVVGAGTGALCINCHKSRRDGNDYTWNYLDNLSSHYGPHYGVQADMLLGENIPTWGYDLPSSPHFKDTDNACVDCHMSDEGGAHKAAPYSAGGHTFSMVDTAGHDNVAACSPCHGTIGEEFGDKKYYINNNADHDGNGVEEGLQHEVHGLLDTLITLIPNDGEGHPTVVDSSVTLNEATAAYIYLCVEEDRSAGVHNPAFTIALLQTSIKVMRGIIVDVPDEDNLRPNDYELGQNYPNPFNPTTTIKYAIKESGKVQLRIYDMMGREVATLVNKKMAPGKYEVNFDASKLASGVYFYRIIAGNGQFTQVNKMILMK